MFDNMRSIWVSIMLVEGYIVTQLHLCQTAMLFMFSGTRHDVKQCLILRPTNFWASYFSSCLGLAVDFVLRITWSMADALPRACAPSSIWQWAVLVTLIFCIIIYKALSHFVIFLMIFICLTSLLEKHKLVVLKNDDKLKNQFCIFFAPTHIQRRLGFFSKVRQCHHLRRFIIFGNFERLAFL